MVEKEKGGEERGLTGEEECYRDVRCGRRKEGEGRREEMNVTGGEDMSV